MKYLAILLLIVLLAIPASAAEDQELVGGTVQFEDNCELEIVTCTYDDEFTLTCHLKRMEPIDCSRLDGPLPYPWSPEGADGTHPEAEVFDAHFTL